MTEEASARCLLLFFTRTRNHAQRQTATPEKMCAIPGEDVGHLDQRWRTSRADTEPIPGRGRIGLCQRSKKK